MPRNARVLHRCPFTQAVHHVAGGTLPIAVPPPIAASRFQDPNSPSLAQRGDAAFRLASEVIAKRKRLGWLGEFRWEPRWSRTASLIRSALPRRSTDHLMSDSTWRCRLRVGSNRPCRHQVTARGEGLGGCRRLIEPAVAASSAEEAIANGDRRSGCPQADPHIRRGGR
jgi:hypothetical protein